MEAKCKELRPLLKEIDPDFDINWNFPQETYTITHKGYFFMNVNYGEFDRKTFENIRKIVWQNIHGTIFDDIDKHNEKIEKAQDRHLSNIAETMAKDMRKPLADLYYHGG